jgi:phosphopantothenoylcysteine decarboxylase
MADSPLIAAYSEQEQPTLPSAGVAALETTYPTTSTTPGIAPYRQHGAADALVQQIAHEADVDASSSRANRFPIVIAGIPLGGLTLGENSEELEGEVESTPAGGIISQAPRRPRVLLGISGSVATIKLTQLTTLLLDFADVHVVSTKSARHFFNEAELPKQCGPVLTDEDEWRNWKTVGDPVVHIELRRWADLLVIAPLSANTLAKIANGLCDNLLTCVVRAWDSTKPVLVAPAMNTYMWNSPFTSQHVGNLEKLGFTVIAPVSKKLACGDVGNGGMAAPETIVDEVRSACIAAGLFVE